MARRAAAATAGTAALLAAAPATAGAGQPVIEHFRGTYEHVEQDFGWCLEVPFPIRHAANFESRVRVFTGSDGLQRLAISWSNRGVYENTDTGTSFDFLTVVDSRDARVTDNGDGTLSIEIEGHETSVVHTPDGGLYGINSGRFTGELLVDHNGTPEDWDDDVLLSEQFTDPNGVSTLGGVDECAVAAELLG